MYNVELRIRIAKAIDANMIATAGLRSELDIAKRLGGAHEVLNYNRIWKIHNLQYAWAELLCGSLAHIIVHSLRSSSTVPHRATRQSRRGHRP